jgi:hypothetical protein
MVLFTEEKMNQRAQKIWKTFCDEVIRPPSEDQKEALASAIRMIIDEYEIFMDNDSFGNMVVTSNELRILADELDK